MQVPREYHSAVLAHTQHQISKLRSKPVLTRSDKLKLFRFAKKYKGQSRKGWRTHIQLHRDNKGGGK